MKKIIVVLAAITLAIAPAAAQKIDYDGLELRSGKGVDSNLRVAFPMFFGFSMPRGADSATCPQNKFFQSFYYGLEMASIRFASPNSPIEFSLGLRWTFMDIAFEDTSVTYRPSSEGGYKTVPIIEESATYDGTKSKVHANYLGIPARLYFTAGKAKLYAGASADYMIKGWTKYRNPGYREYCNDLFNRFRASAEAGASYGIIGIFANYSFTPFFTESISKSGVISFGLTLGM